MIKQDGIRVYSNRAALDELARLSASVRPPHCIVELGVYQGGSLATLAGAAKVPVYGVDAFGAAVYGEASGESGAEFVSENEQIARDFLTGRGVFATLIRGFTTTVAASWDGPTVGMLYLDAEHSEAGVLADFEAWQRRLVSKATVAFDDYSLRFPGVVRAVDRLADAEIIDPPSVIGGRLAVSRLR